ncbi:AIPR family protein [Azospirillum thermophilum]|uniref:AIPR family protein n=1 Tax=Azospirillum thermophilum TaxID=2202148 RepID=A0A2S2CKH5_9PROT|nr:AIPR family protein [Azospirillum thermophilum]AWK85003.1 AIPR family protein [Azospirillum thermophilum]
MHKVVEQHLKDFKSRFGVAFDRDKSFEAFLSYCVLRIYSADNVQADTLTYDGDDPGIDGILFFVDDVYVSSIDEMKDVFKKSRRDVDVIIAMTQAKTSESWDKKEINAFQSAILDFLSDSPHYPHASYIAEKKELFDEIIKNVGKIRGGKPQIHCFFGTTARKTTAREITAAFRTLKRTVDDTGFFSDVVVVPVDRDHIIEMWDNADGPVEANLTVFASAPFPKTPGVEESYVVTARAKDFVRNVLSDKNDNLQKRIFEQNVRDYIGADAEVNAEILETLSHADKQKRFGMLNNGITIVSPDVRVQGNEFYLRNFQIVNGCQTSHLLFESRKELSEDVTVMLKVIETSEPAVVDEIVRSTNRQTKVQDDQFLATLDCMRSIEKFFNARGADEEHRLYFERRKNQFWNEDSTPAEIRVFDIKSIARCTGAMFFDKPDLASRYPNRLTGELSNMVFRSENVEDIHYTAAYASYRLQLLFSNQKIDSKYRQLKWHILMSIKYYVAGDGLPQPTSNKIRSVCAQIDKFMSGNDDETLARIQGICALYDPMDGADRDKLKVHSFIQEAKKKAVSAYIARRKEEESSAKSAKKKKI